SSSRLAAFLLLLNVGTKDRINAALVTRTLIFKIVEHIRIDADRNRRLLGGHHQDRLGPVDIKRRSSNFVVSWTIQILPISPARASTEIRRVRLGVLVVHRHVLTC